MAKTKERERCEADRLMKVALAEGDQSADNLKGAKDEVVRLQPANRDIDSTVVASELCAVLEKVPMSGGWQNRIFWL